MVVRDFLWIVARNRVSGDPVNYGFWSGGRTVDAAVLNPDTGVSETRRFTGAGQMVKIGSIPLVANIEVQDLRVDMTAFADKVVTAVRENDVKQGRVEVYRGFYDPSTHALIESAKCRFVGFVDELEIVTPTENNEGSCVLTCRSHTQELTRLNPAKRSHEDQLLRNSSDAFFKDAAAIGEVELYWGRKPEKVGANAE